MKAPVILATLSLCAAAMLVLPASADGPATLVVGATGQYATIQAAVDAAQPGDTILVQNGVYDEAVIVTTPGLTIMGESRLGVVLEGGSQLDSGITVTGGGHGVTVRTMTAQNYVNNGFVFSHVNDFTMTDLYAKNNGEYGLYAIHSKHGDISYSYGEGQKDSAFYIGETTHCDCDVHHNVGWNNMLGYSGTANSYVRIWQNEFFHNRAGILMSVLPNEMGYDTETNEVYGTQVHTKIYDNYIHDNNNHTDTSGVFSTVHPPVGEGITIAGGWFNEVYNNTLVNNGLWGVGVFWLTTPPRGNHVHDNLIDGSRYGLWWDEWGEDNCFEDNVAGNVDVYSDPDPLPDCTGPAGPAPCPPALTDWSACRFSDARVVDPVKEADLAWRALVDADPDEDLVDEVGA